MTAEAPPPSTREELVHLIEGTHFTPVRLREGYDMGEVDKLLDAVVLALHGRQPIRGLVDGARITPVRLREGYDMGEVDKLLDLIAETDDRLVADAGAPGADDPVEMLPASPGRVDTTNPSVISEERGLFDKLFRRNR